MPETLEDRLARKAQAGATPAPTTATPMAGAPLSLEDRLRQKSLAGSAAPVIPPPPGGGQTDTQPGFWSKTYDATLRPFVDQPGQNIGGIIGGVIGAPGYLGGPAGQAYRIGITALGGATGQAVEDFIREAFLKEKFTTPQEWERQFKAAMNMAAAAGGGELMNAAAQQYARLGAKGALKWLGSKIPGSGIEPPVPAATPPPPVPGLQQHIQGPMNVAPAYTTPKLTKAEQTYSDVRAKLPAVSAGTLKAQTEAGAEAALSKAYVEREGLRQAARRAPQKVYSIYDKAVSHPANLADPGLELKPAEFTKNAAGETVMTKPAVKTTTPFNSPVETAPFRTELEQLIEHDKYSPFPAGSPIRKFLDALGPEKGYDYVQFDTLKKALGKLSVYADPGLKLADPDQRLARQIISDSRQPLLDKLNDIAERSGIPIKRVQASMEAGDVEWAKYNKMFGSIKAGSPLGKGEAAYAEQNVLKGGKAPAIGPTPGIPTVRHATEALKGVRQRAGLAVNLQQDVVDKAASDVVKHLTSNPSNLDMYTKVMGPEHLPEVLGALVDDIKNTKTPEGLVDYGRWFKLDPQVITKLTAHQPDLANTITSAFGQLDAAQAKYGAQATQRAITRAMTRVDAISKSLPVRYLSPLPTGIHAAVGDLTQRLQNQDAARRFNQALRTEIARIPLSTRVARTAGTAAGIAAQKVAVTPPPPEPTKMAGEQ